MTKLAPKRVSDSMTSQVQIIMPEHINGYHRLFGGQLVEWIDVVAGVDRKSTRLNSSHDQRSRMPSSA